MKKTCNKSNKFLFLSLVVFVTLLSILFAVSAFASETTDDAWTFTADSVKDPLYVQNYFTELPRAFEAEVNIPAGSYGGSSPIIANWPNYNTRNAFGFQINKDGSPSIYYYSTSYDVANAETVTQKDMATFDYNVYGKGWVRLSAVNEIVDGSPVYKLYVNGVLTDTITTFTVVHDFDPISSQRDTRELSIGNDGKHYFKGELRNVAVYKTLTAEEAAKTAKENMQSGNSNLVAYYDASMSGNTADLIKDQTGNGHDATKAFFERKNQLNNYAYSFAFIGDTQFLVEQDVNGSTTKYTSPIYDWIIANKTDKNIQHVFGLGDITDNNSDAEWEYAVTLHEKLGAAGVDYSIIPGNHDDYTTPAKKYNQYFGQVSSFVNSIDGYYIDGRLENFYTKFEVGQHKYMVIGLQYGATDDVLAWANNVVASNGDRRVIVLTHSLFDMNGNWALKDTPYQTTTSVKTLNNGIDIWNKFISLHENIIIATAGHITSNIYQPKAYVGVNGNTVNTLLIDPQGFDMATGYDTGFVAMFYFSEDGSDVQVECVSTTKTLRAQSSDPESDDILFHEKNQYSFKIDFEEADIKNTEYGELPSSVLNDGSVFAIFSGGEFKGGYKTWKSATSAVAELFTQNRNADVQMLLLSDYTNTDDALSTKALSYANGNLTVDLGGHTLTRSQTLFNLNIGSETTNVEASNILVKNGHLRTLGKPIIDNQISNYAYEGEKTWNLTFDNVKLGYGETLSSRKEVFYSAWTNSATANESQLGTKTNLTFNNCTFDLKTNAPDAAVTLFNLMDDHTGVDKIDITVKINGGTVFADIADLANVTFYTLNEGSDSVIFGEYNGAYTKLQTHTTAKDYEHYSKAFPAADGDRYFVEILDSGKESVYELRKIKPTSYEYEMLDGTVMIVNTADSKYLSDVDYPGIFDVENYPFILFDQTGKYYGAYSQFLGNAQALGSAVYYVVNKNTLSSGNTAYLLMRSDYTLKSDEKFDNTSHARGHVVIDMCGYTITSDSSRTTESIFDATSKDYNSKDGVLYFESEYTVRNGSFKIHSSYVIKFKSSNSVKEIEKKNMIWNFENVSFGLVKGSKLNGFFHVKTAADSALTAPMAPLELSFDDCTFDVKTVVPTKSPFYVLKTNYAEGGRIKATVKVNGGTVLANNLSNIDLENFIYSNGCTFTYGPGKDGKYLSAELGMGQSISKFNSETLKNDAGATFSFVKVSENTTDGTELYRLRPIELADVNYSPKISITLDSQLVLNVYIPVKNTQKFVFNSKTYENLETVADKKVTVDGADYYLLTVDLPSAQSAQDIKLIATVSIGDKTATATFTFSIPKYAKKILDDKNIADAEKALVRDVLSYVRAAYVYFGTDDAQTVSRINAILGENYDANNAPAVEGSATVETVGLKSATFVLDGTPAMRFYLADGADASKYEFFINGTRVKTETSADGKYIDIDVYAYALCETVTYTIDGAESGSFHIRAYYEWSKTQNNENLVNLTARFWKYLQSARDFRDSVVEG